jgi:hypothetical protein
MLPVSAGVAMNLVWTTSKNHQGGSQDAIAVGSVKCGKFFQVLLKHAV